MRYAEAKIEYDLQPAYLKTTASNISDVDFYSGSGLKNVTAINSRVPDPSGNEVEFTYHPPMLRVMAETDEV